MHQFCFTILVLFTFSSGYSQVKAPVAFKEYEEGINPIDEIRLFDLAEIKARKIDTAYIIYHPASWAEYHPTGNPCTCPYNDTLALYRFDSEGRIIQTTHFIHPKRFSTAVDYDTLGRRKDIDYSSDTAKYKTIITRRKIGTDSIVTDIFFLKFKNGMDTATVVTKRYNSTGTLIEIHSEVNKRNAREFNDDTGSDSYHFKYEYDDRKRLIYYQDFESGEYRKISYPFYGKLTERILQKLTTLKGHK